MDAQALHDYIWEGIRKEVLEDRVELYLPWYFTGDDEPLRLTFRQTKGHRIPGGVGALRQRGFAVDTTPYDHYEISDNGRALQELEKKVGSLEPYMDQIRQAICRSGTVELVSGRNLTTLYYAVGPHYHTNLLNQLLTAISIIYNLDLVTPIREGGYDEI